MMMLFILLITIVAQIAQLHAALCTWPTSKKSVTLQATMTIASNTDFQYTTYKGGPGILNGNCALNNGNLKYLMILKNGVTIKNAILDTPGLGIYCEGNCILENIYYKTLCYHAAGFGYKSNAKNIAYTYQVIGGAGSGSPDKYFTQSGLGTTIIKNFCAEGKYGKLWCSCGNCRDQMSRSLQLFNTVIKGPGLSVVSLNSNYGDKLSISGLTLYGQQSPSTATSYVCQVYIGLTYMSAMAPTASYKPTQSGSGACSYSANSIKIAS